MRILHVTPSYFPASYWGGPVFSVYGLNKALAAIPGVQLKVLTTDSAGPKRENSLEPHALDQDTLYPNYRVYFSHRIAGHSASLALLLRLPALIRWAEVVHLSAIYSFPTLPTLLFCRFWKKPLVWSPHGTFLTDERRAKPKRKRLKRIWLYACHALLQPERLTLLASSEQDKAASISQIQGARVAVVPNGVEALPVFPQRDYLPAGKMRLLYLGRLDPVKGIENLLEAVKRLDDPSITLAVYGDGDAKYALSLKQRAERLGLLGTSVNFFGQVAYEAKKQAFLNSDVSIYPSYSESFSMTVAESLAHGVPVIASHGTPWQAVVDKGCGLWVENSPERLASAISSMRDVDLAELGKRGWQWMSEEFDISSIGAQVFEIYQSSISVAGD